MANIDGNAILHNLEILASCDLIDVEIGDYSDEELRAAEMALYEREGVILHSQIAKMNDFNQYIVEIINKEIKNRSDYNIMLAKKMRENEIERRLGM